MPLATDPDAPARLTLASRHEQLAELGEWLERVAASRGLSAPTAFRLELVLTEAVTNVMDQAARLGQEGRIELDCAILDDRIVLNVSDDGPAFDPTACAPAILPGTLAEAEPGGLGIHLMRQYTRDMAYRREGKHNVLSMTLPREGLKATG